MSKLCFYPCVSSPHGGNAWCEAVVTKTKVPTYFVEYGFRSKRKNVKFLNDSAYQDKLALLTEKGVCALTRRNFV